MSTNVSDFTYSEEVEVKGQILRPWREFTIVGSNERFAFLRHVKTPKGDEWVEAVGVKKRDARSFSLDRIKTVQKIPKGGLHPLPSRPQAQPPVRPRGRR